MTRPADILRIALRKLRRLPGLLRHLGVGGTLSYAWRTQLKPLLGLGQPLHQPGGRRIDVLGFYDFINLPDTPPQAPQSALPEGTITWVIPDFHIGSGGHKNIFRMMSHLERMGWRQHIVLVGATQYSSAEHARSVVREHFFPLKASLSLGEAGLPPSEFTVATGWQTAYAVRRFAKTRHKLYFVQDFEPDFYPSGSEACFAEQTYRFGFTAITAGDWLAERLRAEYGLTAYPFGFAHDSGVHHPRARRDAQRRVFFYARHVTPRRGFELGLLALARVHQRFPDLHVILAGWDCADYVLPFVHLNAGVVPPKTLAELYCDCDAALVLSLTNASLLPLELMASGCPLVSNNGRNVGWLVEDGVDGLLAEPTVEALSAALIRLLEDPTLRQRLRANGLERVARSTWQAEAAKVDVALREVRQQPPWWDRAA